MPATAVTPDTLTELLEAIARFSAPSSGVTRMAYDPHWREAHRWMAEQARARGLTATPDAAGNLYLHDPALRPGDRSRPVVLVGSHLDSVRDGGRFDGPLGALAGMLAAAECRGAPGLPVVGFVTCEEEGSRFSECFLGARSMLGLVSDEELDSTRDADGISWRQALREVHQHGGAAAPAPRQPFGLLWKPAAQLELHIEQGPVLEAEGLQVGIVERIAGYRRWKAVFRGEARHTGTTPPAHKRDALAAAAEVIGLVEGMARQAGEPVRASAGNILVHPGLFNVVADRVELWLELRHVESSALDALAATLERNCRAAAQARGVTFAMEEVSRQEPQALSAALAQAAEALARERGLRWKRMMSGAAHDTMLFARAGFPALLVFVPSRSGISHSPNEYTAPEDLWAGYQLLRELCRSVAAAPPAS